jgi:hypothetical protein
MSFASFVNKAADLISNTARGIAESGVIPKAVGKATRVGLNVGKTAGNFGFKVGMGTINTTLDAANFVADNHKTIAKGLKRFGEGVVSEVSEHGHAALGVVGKMDEWLMKPTTLDKSLIGRKFNAAGLLTVTAGMTLINGGKATAEYVQNRQGQNDGRLYRPTAQMSTPYALSEQMAYSQHGRSFADNAGATGDLVFALNNMRNG